jgi:DNA-binding winged helix-turn-helix (wHTH) protein
LIFTVGNFVLDESRFELRHGPERLAVQPKVLRLLLYLVAQRDRPVSSDELLQVLWPGEHVTLASVKRAIRGARRALGDTGDSQSSIRTVRGRGYELVLPVNLLEETRTHASTPRSNSSVQDAFIGRHRALELLESSMLEAFNGYGRVVLLAGEPGIGKTRTLLELARRAVAAGADAWFGRCLEDEGTPAFWPWTQILRDGERDRGVAPLLALMGHGAADIAEGIPELRQSLPDLPEAPPIDQRSARFRFFDSMSIFLKRAAHERPLVLLFDDLQRADRPTLRLLSFVARQLDTARVLIVASLRPMASQAEGAKDTLTGLVQDLPAACLTLEGLDRTEVDHYVELRTGRRAPEAIVDRLLELTAGNPLFLQHVLQSRPTNDELDDPNTWDELLLGAQALGLSGAIARLLSALDEPCRYVLGVASILGTEFTLGRVVQLLETDAGSVLARLATAKAAGVVRETSETVGGFRFNHLLLRNALYEQLEVNERARLHARAGLMLETGGPASYATVSELAHHFGQAWPTHDAGKALHYALIGAEAAKQRLAYEEAAAHLDRGLQYLANGALISDLRLRMQLLLGKGEALTHAAEVVKARAPLFEAVSLARELGATDALARAATLIARLPESGNVDWEAIGILREALAELPQEDPQRPFLLALLAKSTTYCEESAARAALVFHALEQSKCLEDPKLRSETLHQCHRALAEPQHLGEREAIADELLRLSQVHGDNRILWHASTAQVQNCLERGDFVGVGHAIAALEGLAVHAREPVFRWNVASFRAMRSYVAGEIVEAEHYARAALQMGTCVGPESARKFYASQVVGWFRITGRIAEADALAREMTVRFPTVVGWRIVLACVEADQGRPELARRTLATLMEKPSALHDPFALAMLAPLSELCAYLGTADMARTLYKLVLPFGQLWGNVDIGLNTYGPMARHLGMLAARAGEIEVAQSHLEDALARSEAASSPTFTSLTCLVYARAALKHGSVQMRRRAAELLKSAESINQRHGFRGLSTAARMVAERAGLPLPVDRFQPTFDPS